MEKRRAKKLGIPPVLKLLLRGYMVMGFILLMVIFGIIDHVPLVIFLITLISVSMVFGVGCLLVMGNRPIRSSGATIPNTALFFAKGIMVLYFISMLAEFRILPERITSMLMLAVAGMLVLGGAGSYLLEVLQRSRPVPRVKLVRRPRTR